MPFASYPHVKRRKTNDNTTPGREHTMKKEYDWSTMKSRKNPYATNLKKPVTIRLSDEVLSYFKQMADDSGVPYQSHINLYLRDCVLHRRKMAISWQNN